MLKVDQERLLGTKGAGETIYYMGDCHPSSMVSWFWRLHGGVNLVFIRAVEQWETPGLTFVGRSRVHSLYLVDSMQSLLASGLWLSVYQLHRSITMHFIVSQRACSVRRKSILAKRWHFLDWFPKSRSILCLFSSTNSNVYVFPHFIFRITSSCQNQINKNIY